MGRISTLRTANNTFHVRDDIRKYSQIGYENVYNTGEFCEDCANHLNATNDYEIVKNDERPNSYMVCNHCGAINLIALIAIVGMKPEDLYIEMSMLSGIPFYLDNLVFYLHKSLDHLYYTEEN